MWGGSSFSHGKKRFPWDLQLGSKSCSERGTGRAKHHPIAAAGFCEYLLDLSRSLSDGEVRVKTKGLLPSPAFAFWGFSPTKLLSLKFPRLGCSLLYPQPWGAAAVSPDSGLKRTPCTQSSSLHPQQWDMTAAMAGRASSQNPDVEPGSCRLPSGGEACSSLPWMNSPLNFPGLAKKPKATPGVILRLNAMIFPCKKKLGHLCKGT